MSMTCISWLVANPAPINNQAWSFALSALKRRPLDGVSVSGPLCGRCHQASGLPS